MKRLVILTLLLSACTTQPTYQPQILVVTPDQRFALQDAQIQLATAERLAAIQTADAETVKVTGTAIAQSTLDTASRDATTTALAMAPVLTLGAATSTSQYSTQIAKETAISYPLTATPAAAIMASNVKSAQTNADVEQFVSYTFGAARVIGALILLLAVAFVAWQFADWGRRRKDFLLKRDAMRALEEINGQRYRLEKDRLIWIPLIGGPDSPIDTEQLELEEAWRESVRQFGRAAGIVGSLTITDLARKRKIVSEDEWADLTEIGVTWGIFERQSGNTGTVYAQGKTLIDLVEASYELAIPLPRTKSGDYKSAPNVDTNATQSNKDNGSNARIIEQSPIKRPKPSMEAV